MSLKERINEDMKAAMRARESARLSAIRLLMAAIKQREVDERIELDDAGVLAVIDKMQKQRRDSIAQYQAANRPELAQAEQFELDVLAAYMPRAADEGEINAAVAAALAETGAASMQDMGRDMALLKTRLAGRADMAQLSARVRQALSPRADPDRPAQAPASAPWRQLPGHSGGL